LSKKVGKYGARFMNKNYCDYNFKKENNNEHNNKINVLVIKPKNKINKLKVGVSLISSLLIFYLMIGKNLSLNKKRNLLLILLYLSKRK
jgi:hypothetical protein